MRNLRSKVMSLSFLLLLPQFVNAEPKVLMAGSYVETKSFLSFVRSLEGSSSLAVCDKQIVRANPKLRVTGCSTTHCAPPSCKPNQCTKKTEEWKEVDIFAEACDANFFLRDLGQVSAGQFDTAQYDFPENRSEGNIKGYKIQFSGKIFHLSVARQNKIGKIVISESGKQGILIHEIKITSEDLSCALNWAGDLNKDQFLDLYLSCSYDVYHEVRGLFLSQKSKYKFYQQKDTGGRI